MRKDGDGISSSNAKMSSTSFKSLVWRHYRLHGRRNLPWRKNTNPYRILVSEIMLQQTQVERVAPLYETFVRAFPTARKLACTPLSEVLKSWQGLGYNRRAKMLHAAAKRIAEGRFPRTVPELEALPGVGQYTARAIAAFAYNQDVILVETNIRTAILHHFFPGKEKVSDKAVERILEELLPKGKAREWYSALMTTAPTSSVRVFRITHGASGMRGSRRFPDRFGKRGAPSSASLAGETHRGRVSCLCSVPLAASKSPRRLTRFAGKAWCTARKAPLMRLRISGSLL